MRVNLYLNVYTVIAKLKKCDLISLTVISLMCRQITQSSYLPPPAGLFAQWHVIISG